MTTMRKAETRVFPSIKIWLLIAVLVICGTASFASCSSNEDNSTEQSNITNIADKVWAFSQSHPDGFTIDIRTMTEPTEGIAVSYAATLNSHSRDQLDKVVSHALQHEGYVGGWYNSEDGLYYFDSTKLFPESDLKVLSSSERRTVNTQCLSYLPIRTFPSMEKLQILLNVVQSSLAPQVTTDRCLSVRPTEPIGALASKWLTRLLHD